MGEVEEYAEPLSRKLRLPLHVVLLAIATLPVTLVEREEYSDSIAEATRRIGGRDVVDEAHGGHYARIRSRADRSASRTRSAS